ncbi:MAG: MFS transporter [Ktedonobacterales bacterium]
MANIPHVTDPSDPREQDEHDERQGPEALYYGEEAYPEEAEASGSMTKPSVPGLRPRALPLADLSTNPRLVAIAGSGGFKAVLGNRYFLRLWLAQVISQTIMNAANYAMIILVSNVGGSVTATSGAIVAFSLPAALFGAPAGVLVDRFDRRSILYFSNLLRAAACVLFVVTLLINPKSLWPIYALTFFIALVGQFFSPAEGAAIPKLVKKQELINALALFNITFTLAQAAGLIILGPLALLLIPTLQIGSGAHSISIPSVVSLFAIVTVLYLVCAALILTIPKDRLRSSRRTQSDGPRQRMPHRGRRLRGIWPGIAESWNFLRKDKVLFVSVWQLTLAGIIIAVVATIAPRFVQVFFHLSSNLAVLVFLPAGLGLVLGSALTPNIARRLRYTLTITIGVVTLSLSVALLSFTHALAPLLQPHFWWSSWPYLAIMLSLTFLIGIGLDFINVPAQTRVQEHSPDFIKGRVLALQIMLLNAITVITVPLVALAADHFGLPTALILLSVAVAAAGLFSVYYAVRVQHGDDAPGQAGGVESED